MELTCRYTDPESVEENKLEGYDITNYIEKYTWSGDESQAGRKLEFSIAFNTPMKEKTFPIIDLKLGGSIQLAYTEDTSQSEMDIFVGRIFFRKRSTDGYTFQFTAYDDAIYLAKNHIRVVIDDSVTSAFKKVCDKIKFPYDKDKLPDISTHVTKVFDDSSCTEIFQELFKQAKADPAVNKDYTMVCLDGKATIVPKGTLIEGYTATAEANVFGAEHSESIEDMVNRVIAVDEAGNEYQMFTIEDDVNDYGLMQAIYKARPPKEKETVDNVKEAKAKLQRVKNESSLKGLGCIQCITGYSINVQEEQLKGRFSIKADSHDFSNGTHTMSLTLEYMDAKQPVIKQQTNAEPVFKPSKKGRKKRSASRKRGASA